MTSRKYDQILVFQIRDPETLPSGQIKENWRTLITRRGHVIQTGRSDGLVNNQQQYSEDYTVSLPFDPDASRINPMETRILWKARTGDLLLNIIGRDASGTGRTPELILYTTLDK